MTTQPRTTRSYDKALRHRKTPAGKTIHLYCTRLDGRAVFFWITCGYKRLWEGSKEDAAQTAFEQQLNGIATEQAIVREKDAWLESANDIEANPARPLRQDLIFPVLAAIEYVAILRRGKTKRHANVTWTVADALKGLPPIPSDPDEFYAWGAQAVEKVCKLRVLQRADDLEKKGSQNARRVRINMLVACLTHIERLPALRTWAKGLPQVLSRVKSRRIELVSSGIPEESRPPFSKKEILSIIDSCNRFEDVALAIAYLTLGTRSGDAEQADYSHIINDQYELVRIQSKTKTHKRPAVPLVLKILLRYKNQNPFEFGFLSDEVDKQRFRPTVGLLLTMAGQNPLVVSTRLGHSTISIMVSHYVKIFPADYGGHKDVWSYLGIGPVSIGGHKTNENAWDNFLLFQLLKQADRFGIKNAIRDVAITELSGEQTEALLVADF